MGSYKDAVGAAHKNFELAKRYKGSGNKEAAMLLYRKAVELAIKALYLKETGKSPPKGASATYIARRTEMPLEVSEYISVMEEKTAEEASEMEPDLQKGEEKLFYLEGLAKRLIDSTAAVTK
jgi:HEPN domain-containing protein